MTRSSNTALNFHCNDIFRLPRTVDAIHPTKIPTGPTGKRGPPQKVDPFFRNFSGWTEPIHWVLDRNFRKVWLNGSRPVCLNTYGTFDALILWKISKEGNQIRCTGQTNDVLSGTEQDLLVLLVSGDARTWSYFIGFYRHYFESSLQSLDFAPKYLEHGTAL